MLQVEMRFDRMPRLPQHIARQLPFINSLAINNTAKDFQKVQRRHQLRAFTVRRKSFVERAVKIKPFATKRRLEATISIDPPGGQSRADILAKFEPGGVKRPQGRSLAIPEDVKRTGKGVIPKGKRPRTFRFTFMGTGPKGAKVFRGNRRTFLIQNADGTGGIYQRTGRRARKRGNRPGAGRRLASSIATRQVRDLNIRTLFRFTPQARIDRRLKFIQNAKGVVRANFAKNFHAALVRAVGQNVSGAGRQARRIARADVFGAGRRS